MKNIKTKFKIDKSTYCFLLIYFLSGYIKNIIIIYLIVIIHELGHVVASKVFNREITSITIYPFGGITKTNSLINSKLNEDLIIFTSGIFFQIILSVIVNLNKQLFNSTIILFNHYNTYILLFNILPIIPLDGFLIVNNLINRITSYYNSLYLSQIISIVFILIFIIFYHSNILISLVLIYSIYIYSKNKKNNFNKFLLERYLYCPKYSKNKYINENSLLKLRQNNNCFFKTKKGYINEYELLSKKFDKLQSFWYH